MEYGVSLQAGGQLFPEQNGHMLNCKEAKSRLKKLTAGTEEHTQLQDVLFRTNGISEIVLPTMSYKVNTSSSQCGLSGGFGSSEHIAIGEEVVLHVDQVQCLPKDTPLLTKGVTPVSFAQIIALAGDFYGVPGEAISLPGGSDANKTERFKKAFATLVDAPNSEVSKIIWQLNEEYQLVKESSLHRHCYSSHLVEQDNVIHKIKPDIHDLLVDNSDHFSENAKDAYRIGHNYAIEVAREAGKTKDLDGLKRAYAIDAFACHFLTDLFAAGHIRNQRGKLEEFLISIGFSGAHAKPLAGVLTAAQHEKDGTEGLNVANKRGESWRAFGDGNFFTPKNADNKTNAVAATQASANEIYRAYSQPDVQHPGTVEDLIPFATSCNRLPIYSVEKNGGSLQLFILRDGKKIEVTNKLGYINEGIPQAIRYLPEGYIDGFVEKIINPLNIGIDAIPVIKAAKTVVVPQWEKLTGTVWHLVGLSTYYQARIEHQRLNDKINEVADMVEATYKNTVEILKQMHLAIIKLDKMEWKLKVGEIEEAIKIIQDSAHHYRLYYKTKIDPKQLEEIENDLFKAYIRLSRVFNHGTALENDNMLTAYKESLDSSMQPADVNLKVTFWFRQMLEYQVQAFGFYLMLSAARDPNTNINDKVCVFESDIMNQVQANQAHIDIDLIYQSHHYLTIQMERSKVKQLQIDYL